jgi:cytochrome c-type biogenesis protein CcmH/NrfG
VRAEALAALERGAEASQLATGALQSEPSNRYARRALAIVAIQTSDFATADAALSKLVSEDAKDVDSLYYLALLQRRRNRYNSAREGFLAVLRLNAQHIDARFNLVTLTAAAGAEQEADHDYQELLQIAPVGDPRLIAARSALRSSGGKDAPIELPVLHQSSPAPSVAPPR